MLLNRRLSARWMVATAAMFACLAVTVFVVTRTLPANAATDLALGKPASTDSAEAGRAAPLVNDGNAATRWCAANGATGHWWQVDLGSTAQLTGTSVTWEFARNYKYVIAVSTDGTTWTTAVDKRGNTGTAQTQTDAFSSTARYVRITVTGLAAGTWASMYSFSVYGTPGSTPGPTTPTPSPTAAPAAFKGVANSACADLTRLTVSWYYNWGTSPGSCRAAEFVPMIWGQQKTPAAVTNALNEVSRAGYRTVLGFNEPDKSDQSNMPVSKVLELWPHLTANPNVKVGSPATSAGADGQAWFREFMRQADAGGLRIDFITVHWYGWNAGSCDAKAANFESYLRWIESFTGNRPIWITEYGCLHKSNPDPATVEAFYKGSLEVFARHPRVQRYAWYPWITNNHLVQEGAPTSLGTTFAKAPTYR